MEGAFGAVVIVVSLLALVAAVIALATSRGAYARIGRGELSVEDEPAPEGDVEDVRRLLEAASARRVARGEAPLDVDQELLKRLREG